jgi:hypothetical protein
LFIHCLKKGQLCVNAVKTWPGLNWAILDQPGQYVVMEPGQPHAVVSPVNSAVSGWSFVIQKWQGNCAEQRTSAEPTSQSTTRRHRALQSSQTLLRAVIYREKPVSVSSKANVSSTKTKSSSWASFLARMEYEWTAIKLRILRAYRPNRDC